MFVLALLDVSHCMAQQTQLGLTLLECAKSAVEQLLDSRRREGLAQRDQYMLVTTADTPLQPHSDGHTHVVCGWHDNARFLGALKAVQPLPSQPADSSASSSPSTYLSTAITASLDLLNRYSRPNGIDNFARGRILHYNEPALLLLLTTDQRTQPALSLQPTYAFTPSSLPASAYATAPYRWDQRLFAVVLRLGLRERGGALQSASSMALGASAGMKDGMAGAKSGNNNMAPSSPLSAYLAGAAEQTGGNCTVATTFTSLLSHIDNLSKRPCPNVFIHLTPQSSTAAQPASPRTPPPASDTAAANSLSSSTLWRYRSEFVGVYVKAVGVWPCPETYLADPAIQTLPPREPHPTFYFSIKPKPLPALLLDSASTVSTTTPAASQAAAPSIAVSSAPPTLPPLESSIPADTYTLDPSAPICTLLFADDSNTCRYVSVNPTPSSVPFGLLYANKAAKKAYLVVLPYDFPTFFSYLARIDTHLRSLPLTSSSSAALTSNPALYSAFAGFLAALPFYYWPAVQAALGKVHRLPRQDVRMDAGVVGGLGAEIGERMRRWKEEAGRAMRDEKEAREREGKPVRREHFDGERVEGGKRKRRRENVNNGDAAASQATAELHEDTKLRRRPLSPEEAEVEWLLAPSTAEERPLLPPPNPPRSSQEAKEDRSPWRQRGRVAVVDLFELRDDEVDSAMSEWRERAMQLLQPYPLLASVLPPPPAPPLSASPAQLTLRPRLAPSPHAPEPAHPIAAMGDFQTYLRSLPPPLRQPIDSGLDDGDGGTGAGLLSAFGSPYRRHGRRALGVLGGVVGGVDDVDGDGDVDVNERDVAVVGGELQQTRGRGKWKPKPSLREFVGRKEKADGDEWMQHR